MPVQPIDSTHINQALQSDMTYVRSFQQWVSQRYQVYNQNLTAAAMTAASISAADQTIILAFIGDLNRLKQLMAGTLPASATDVLFNITNYLGML